MPRGDAGPFLQRLQPAAGAGRPESCLVFESWAACGRASDAIDATRAMRVTKKGYLYIGAGSVRGGARDNAPAARSGRPASLI